MINELIVAICLVTGTFLMFLAGVGALRMPDLLMRMHATTKSSVLGTGLIMTGVASYFLDNGATGRSLAIVVFIMLTASVAAHMIGRSAYFVGVPLWSRIVKDELKGRYDHRTHILRSTESRDD